MSNNLLSKLAQSNLKLGLIAGGQLAKMIIQEASKWDITTYVMDSDETCPARSVASVFVKGSRFNPVEVYQFGKHVDILAYEIESINIEALFKLKEEGISVIPDPSILQLIQDKGKQKLFYEKHSIPTPYFQLYNNKNEIIEAVKYEKLKFPFVQKIRVGGYDGRGIAVINSENDLNNLLEGASVVENKISIDKEISVLIARNANGETKTFPVVEMIFEKNANLVDMLLCPANINKAHEIKAFEIAKNIIEKLDMVGLLAVELFISEKGEVMVNEIAPRTHNSGHHTLESVLTSQFEQHVRSVINLPLGSTDLIMPAVMVNILGEPGVEGKVFYQGLSEIMAIEGVNVHLYGKKITKPYRKMGHVTIVDREIEKAITKATQVKNILKATIWKNH